MTPYTFCVDSMVRGYHEYQSMWDNPLADRNLPCEWELGNSHNPQAMAIKNLTDALQVVGHVPRKYLKFVRYSQEEVAVLHVEYSTTRHWQYL